MSNGDRPNSLVIWGDDIGITNLSCCSDGLSKVGIPAARWGCRPRTPPSPSCSALPTAHGFDEFFGNLYHLNAEEDPESPNYPPPEDFPALPGAVRAAGVLHSWATDEDDATEQPRWGRVGRQRIEDTGNAVLRLVQHHPHALSDPPQAGEARAGRALAVALSRHDGRP